MRVDDMESVTRAELAGASMPHHQVDAQTSVHELLYPFAEKDGLTNEKLRNSKLAKLLPRGWSEHQKVAACHELIQAEVRAMDASLRTTNYGPAVLAALNLDGRPGETSIRRRLLAMREDQMCRELSSSEERESEYARAQQWWDHGRRKLQARLIAEIERREKFGWQLSPESAVTKFPNDSLIGDSPGIERTVPGSALLPAGTETALSSADQMRMYHPQLDPQMRESLEEMRNACIAKDRRVFTVDVLQALLNVPGSRALGCFNKLKAGLGRQLRSWLLAEFAYLDDLPGEAYRNFDWYGRPEFQRAENLTPIGTAVSEVHVLRAILEGESEARIAVGEFLSSDDWPKILELVSDPNLANGGTPPRPRR